MKTYTWCRGRLSDGLELRSHERFGPSLLLGERGRGRFEAIVGLDRKAPPVSEGLGNQRVLECDARTITLPARDGRPEKSFIILTAQRGKQGAVLVRVCTQWVYTRSTSGRYTPITGEVQELACGRGAHGDAGRIGSWVDALLLMPFGAEIEIRPEGGYKTDTYRLWVDAEGNAHASTLDERQIMLAMEMA